MRFLTRPPHLPLVVEAAVGHIEVTQEGPQVIVGPV